MIDKEYFGMAVSDARVADMQPAYPPRAAVIRRIFFDWAAQPYFALITTFVLAPYFATHVPPIPRAGWRCWRGYENLTALIIVRHP